MRAIEICAGAGGMALGFERAGWEHLALIESAALRCQVLLRNRPDWPVVCADVREWEYEGERPDLLCGGVPCQPASRAGKRKLDKDDRDLWPHLPELIRKTRPRAVCFENVPGVADNPSVRALADYLVKLGWGWVWWRLNAVDFGVPQTRERWFFIAMEDAGLFFDPAPPRRTCKKPVSIAEALKGDWGVASTLPPWLEERLEKSGVMVFGKNANNGFSTKANSSGDMHGPQWNETKRTKQTRDLDEPSFSITAGAGRRHRVVVRGSQKREQRPLDGPMFTIGASRQQKHRIVEGCEVWAMTERQLQRLQAFPDDWMGMTTDMIGDAVPPPLAEAVGRRLAEVLATVEKDG